MLARIAFYLLQLSAFSSSNSEFISLPSGPRVVDFLCLTIVHTTITPNNLESTARSPVKMPVTNFDFQEKYQYQNGFDSYFEYAPVPSLQPPTAQPNLS